MSSIGTEVKHMFCIKLLGFSRIFTDLLLKLDIYFSAVFSFSKMCDLNFKDFAASVFSESEKKQYDIIFSAKKIRENLATTLDPLKRSRNLVFFPEKKIFEFLRSQSCSHCFPVI